MHLDERLLRNVMSSAHEAIDPTGVPGLDVVVGGGLPRGALMMIVGAPGSGKTVLANHIAFNACRAGRRTLILTALSESTSKLISHLRGFAFFDEDLIGDALQYLSVQQFLERGLETTREEVVALARSSRADMVIIDGFRGMYGSPVERQVPREFLYEIGTSLATIGATTIITSEASPHDPALFAEAATADVILGMHYNLVGVAARRAIDVIKSRGQEHLSGLHGLVISSDGIEVCPRLEARIALLRQHALQSVLHDQSGQRAAGLDQAEISASNAEDRRGFDLPELDALLGGGFMPGTCTVIAGGAGTGKTTFAVRFALAGARVDEPVLYISFYETLAQLVTKANQLGFGEELQRTLSPNGSLTFVRMEPVELDPDVVANQLLQLMDSTGARRFVIDGVAEMEEAAHAFGDSRRVAQYLSALLEAQRMQGITSLFTKAIPRTVGMMLDLSQQPLTLSADNVIVLQKMIYRRRLRSTLAVLKTRFSEHDPGIREFTIDAAKGLHVFTLEGSTEGLLESTSEAYELPTEGLLGARNTPRRRPAGQSRMSHGRDSHESSFSSGPAPEDS